MTVKFIGWPPNLATIIPELSGLYPSNALFAFSLNRNPTPRLCSFSSPDHSTSPPFISPIPVHLISASPKMSHLYLSISFLNNSSFPVCHKVLTFHVHTLSPSFVHFTLFDSPLFFPLANFSIQARSLAWVCGSF